MAFMLIYMHTFDTNTRIYTIHLWESVYVWLLLDHLE